IVSNTEFFPKNILLSDNINTQTRVKGLFIKNKLFFAIIVIICLLAYHVTIVVVIFYLLCAIGVRIIRRLGLIGRPQFGIVFDWARLGDTVTVV
ncbi:hypothetical protein, partial [Enterobacter cloacae complex sp. 2DZ2F20B]|uniref:hypothetical protein n=1 Tax=Enterobacter cloacae complex sp. 2DZ2F20B TaxID=2511993 RepID=UPI001027A8DC